MNSIKYQLLKDDYNFVQRQLNEYQQKIEQLRKEKKQAYFDGYKQGRFDEQMKNLGK